MHLQKKKKNELDVENIEIYGKCPECSGRFMTLGVEALSDVSISAKWSLLTRHLFSYNVHFWLLKPD